MKLTLSPREQADSIVLRPKWCPLKEVCLPVVRLDNGGNGIGRFLACFGVSQGQVLSDGSEDTIYTRYCHLSRRQRVPNSIALDFLQSAEFLSAFAQAHSKQLGFCAEDED